MILRKINNNNYKQYELTADALNLPHETKKPYLIALVGGGGKTTTLLNLTHQLSDAGHKVLGMTTTHMQAPPEWNVILENDPLLILSRAQKCGMVIAGQKGDRRGMKMIDMAVYESIYQEFNYIIYEADGSRRHPIKTPADYEPVILPDTDMIIVTMGLSAIGQTLETACHRYELLNMPPDTIITESLAAKIIKNGYGNYAIPTFYQFNQADTPEQIISGKLLGSYFDNVIISNYSCRCEH